MNNLELIITEEAFNDIDVISNFISADNIAAAKKIIDMFFDCFNTLAEFPNMGVYKKEIKSKDTQIFILKKQYLIAYKIKNNKLIILKVSYRYQNIYNIL